MSRLKKEAVEEENDKDDGDEGQKYSRNQRAEKSTTGWQLSVSIGFAVSLQEPK
jgi:hypothetical protein